MASTWPDTCPVCGGPWKVRSKTMGAALQQPHKGRCVNGHWWHETASPTPQETNPPLFIIRTEEDAATYVAELVDVIGLGFFDKQLGDITEAVGQRITQVFIKLDTKHD